MSTHQEVVMSREPSRCIPSLAMPAGVVVAALALAAVAGPSRAEPPAAFPVPLVSLAPSGAEYGMRPDPQGYQRRPGAGVIDTAPDKPRNNAEWFWPEARKIVATLPAEGFELAEGEVYSSTRTDLFASEGFFVTGVGLWVRTRNMYHRIDYPVPPGSGRFTGEVLICDDPFGWLEGKEATNQEFEFYVFVDGKQVVKKGARRLGIRRGSGEKHLALDIPLEPGAKTIRFELEMTPWGAGNKNVELVVTDGQFLAAAAEPPSR